MKMQDALFHWLQMRQVAEARPGDLAARNTLDFFSEILSEDHQLSRFELIQQDDDFYYVSICKEDDEEQSVEKFAKEAVDHLLADIEANPKYNEQ